MPAPNEAALWRAVSASESGSQSGFVPPKGGGYQFDLPGIENLALNPIAGGIAAGRLTGGNLAVLAGVIGTPFDIETAGCVLFLEDISERAYRIDRYLSQFKLAGKLSTVAGVLLGDFSYDEGDKADEQKDILTVFQEYLGPLGVPVLAGFPAGHERFNLTLPMGAQVRLDADQRSFTVCECPTE